MFLPICLLTLLIFFGSHAKAAKSPVISLPYGTFQGFSTGNLTKFLGVPFGHAARFETPKPPIVLHGIQNATEFGPACPQQTLTPPIPGFIPSSYPIISEDVSLTLDVFMPLAKSSKSKLPVFVWIYGGKSSAKYCGKSNSYHIPPGGFESGNSRDIDVSPLLQRSIDVNEPIIVVALNYRVTAFGFLAGKEVGSAGVSNLGTRDQIYGLEWVQQHISAFGGDPDRVVIGGQSAGAISTSLLLLSNKQNSNTLFRGAFMESGSALKSPFLGEGQSDYDNLVAGTNCTDSPDTLDCLRRAPFEALMAAINKTPDFFSYRSLSLVWHPRIDGDVVAEDPLVSISRGQYAKIPIMTGICDDEGTMCIPSTLRIICSQFFLTYFRHSYLPASSQEEIARVGILYPDDATQGSPFDTGTANQLTPEFKRIAAFGGDYGIIGPRRFLLEHASATQDTWSWGTSTDLALQFQLNNTSFGTYHGFDFPIWFRLDNASQTVGVDALINFVNTLDPNRPAAFSTIEPTIFWPKWNMPSAAGNSSLLTFSDPAVVNITAEDFRVDAIRFLNEVLLAEVMGEFK
ncbi:carotenoid ester lipase precursor [Mycena rosella]|uniref:Carboxylic ester hydrolase n=1 Tax=Mycena rosella TaxID=1033263 RepID=A0AAD7C8F4_MYCRO|nr:carotenoid ester lipase precursor [Mycena rosella]